MSQNLPPILQNVIDGLVLGQQTLAMSSPGMEPPRPMGCPNCAQAEAEVDRLKAALDLEARARYSMAEGLAEAKSKLAWYKGNEAAHRVILRQAKMDRDQAREEAQAAKLAQAQAKGDATAMLSYLADLRFALGDNGKRMQDELLDYCRDLRRSKDVIQAALGNGADEAAWEPGEHWADAAARKIRAARGAQCTR